MVRALLAEIFGLIFIVNPNICELPVFAKMFARYILHKLWEGFASSHAAVLVLIVIKHDSQSAGVLIALRKSIL